MTKRKRIIDVIVVASLAIFAVAMGLAYGQNANGQNNTDQTKTNERLKNIEEKLATGSEKPKPAAKVQKGRHIVGNLVSAVGSTLLLSTNYDLKTILTDSSTKFVALNPKGAIKLADLKVGDRLAIYGIDGSDEAGTAALVGRLPAKGASRHAVFGKVKAINGAALTIGHISLEDRIVATVATNSETVIKSKNDTLTFSLLKVGDAVAISGIVDDKGAITAKLIHIIPGLGLTQTSPTATSSATP